MDGLLWLLIVLVFFVFWELKSSNKNLCRILLMTDKENQRRGNTTSFRSQNEQKKGLT